MARGEALVTCPQCNYKSNIPIMALQRNNYHCSHCGSHIPLTAVTASFENQGIQPSRPRPKRPYNRRKRR